MTLDKSKKTLLLIDSNALVHRAFHAFPPNLKTTSGEPVNAVYGFTSLLLDVLQKFNPTHVVAVFDSAGPTHREAEYTQYKANRSEMDSLLSSQFPRIHEVVGLFGIPVLMSTGIEADDLIGTLDKKYSGNWAQTIVVTGDKDLFQLVDEDTFVYLAGSSFSQSKLYNAEDVKTKMGVTPEQITDYKGLSGDPSDNIPGVRGIGPKSACDLIAKFGSVEQIYENIDNVDKKYQAKLVNSQEEAFLSKRLATIHRDIPISFDFAEAEFKNFNVKKVKDFFDDMQFKSLISKLEAFVKKFEVTSSDAFSLFSEENDVNLNIKEWKGEDLDFSEAFFLADYTNLDQNPLYWGIKDFYFKQKDGDTFQVSDNLFNEFWKKFSDKKFFTFDKKRFLHTLLNASLDFESDKISDLGVNAVILSEGRTTFSIKSIFNNFGLNYYELPQSNLDGLIKLKDILDEKSGKDGFKKVIDLENSILSTIMEMERNGITLDLSQLQEFEQSLKKELENLKSQIYLNVGHEFNINSPKQVGEVLFNEKKLPVNRKTKGGAFSTDESTLKKLLGVDPIIENLLNFREIDKLLSTYVTTLPSYVDNSGRIHAVFDQFGAVSGRFASRNPNLQNIPLTTNQGVNIRDSFIASEQSIFISFDYSQQELRILAALAGEKVMVESFNKGVDIHKITAAEVFETTEDQIDSNKRQVGKTINFSVIYGISSFGLSERLKIPRVVADTFIKKYFAKYVSVQKFLNEILLDAREKGYSETILGRRRVNEMIRSNNRNLRSAAERELFNFIIQGSAADIMKIAMSRFDPILQKYPAKLLLQIHDEFLFEYKLDNQVTEVSEDTMNDLVSANYELRKFIEEIHSIMCNAYDIGVNYKVDVSLGTRWGSMKEINF